MSGDNKIDRRHLLKSIAASGAVAKWSSLTGTAAAYGATYQYAAFSPSQALSMESLVDQLIPADDFPGAKDAGVVQFIDQKLTGPYGSFFLPRYQAGLGRLDEICSERFQQPFAALDGSRQSALLHAIAEQTYGAEVHEFFEMVLSDTFAGYYGNPDDGGNREGASWKMIGFKG